MVSGFFKIEALPSMNQKLLNSMKSDWNTNSFFDWLWVGKMFNSILGLEQLLWDMDAVDFDHVMIDFGFGMIDYGLLIERVFG